LPRDVIETEPRSRAKALLQDDTLLTIGEDSRVEISAYSQSVEQDHRRLVIRLVRGQARVLVGRTFSGSGSIVELQTPTALVASREGYFVVDISHHAQRGQSAQNGIMDMLTAGGTVEGMTTVVNLGGAGTVNFRSGGHNVVLDPGQRSMAQARGTPTQPALVLIAADRAATALSKMLQNTEVKDQVIPQAARQAWLANGADAVLPSATKPQPGGKVAQESGSLSSLSQASRMTPPAVISGAATVDSPAVAVQGGGGGGGTPGPQVSAPSNPIPSLPQIDTGGRRGGKGKD
jgi:hypothetical protein